MLTPETFARLVRVVQAKGNVESKVVRGRQYRVITISELTLILELTQAGWRAEGITFELFGAELFLTPDGSISITNDEGGDEIFSLSDATLFSVVGSFLNWRIGVLEKLQV